MTEATKKAISKYILGVRVDFGLTLEDVVAIIETELLPKSDSSYICTTNPEFILKANDITEFKEIINASALSVPDGSGVLMAEKYLATVEQIKKTNNASALRLLWEGLGLGALALLKPESIGTTVTGVELTERVCQLSHEKGYTLFFLGGWPKDKLGRNVKEHIDISTLAADRMRQKYPNVQIIGSTSQFTKNEIDDEKTLAFIHDCMNKHNISSIDFIFVAYNQYTQEKWLKRNMHKVPAKIGVGVGRTFDYLSGNISQPPYTAYKYHISWLYSLIQQPWKFRRIFTAFPIFPLQIFLNALKK